METITDVRATALYLAIITYGAMDIDVLITVAEKIYDFLSQDCEPYDAV